VRIIQAVSAEDLVTVCRLFEEYAASLGIDLAYQGFPAELAGLPGVYAPPRGRLLLATIDDIPAGCVALRPHDGKAGEMKRLYVRPEHRGNGIGRKLVETLIRDANAIGYSLILLDTLPSMRGALRLYESLGFRRRGPYFPSPIAGNVFMELGLD
jgi:ribosomal protein S18 acetylase RimI-like enzyme